jgi:NAD(P)-dependent dehydrogenase (short-subunit alcohol dehydrogenase family)
MSAIQQQSPGSSTLGPRPHEGRTAVITGAALGIGNVYARRLAADGARVILADIADAGSTVDDIKDDGGEAWAARCDVSDASSVHDLSVGVAELGGADILVHNAGIYPLHPVEEITFEEWRRVLAINLDSIFLLTQAFLPAMRAQRWGRIVGIASGMFHAGSPGALHYVTSKGGVIAFVRSLATEVGPDGVTVNAIAPGLIRSHGTSQGHHDQLFEYAVGIQAIKRTGVPEDLAPTLSFLVSEEAGWVTGQTWVVDGGMVRA